jgi:hypothetical protein
MIRISANHLRMLYSLIIQTFIEEYANMPLCENSQVTFSELVEMLALFRNGHHYDLNDTIMASTVSSFWHLLLFWQEEERQVSHTHTSGTPQEEEEDDGFG